MRSVIRYEGGDTMRALAVMLIAMLLPLSAYAGSHMPAENQKTKTLWVELGANLATLADAQKVAAVLDKAVAAGFTAIVLEVKNASGYTAYPSKFAPHIATSAVPRESVFNPYPAPKDWVQQNLDILRIVLDAAKARRLKVYAAVNIFSEGVNIFQTGAAYESLAADCYPFRQPSCGATLHADWLSTYYAASRDIVTASGAQFTITSVNIGRTVFGVATGRIPNRVVLYTREPPAIPSWATGWAGDGVEIAVASDRQGSLTVEAIVDWQDLVGKPYSVAMPPDGFILSAHGAAKQWLLQNLKIGDTLTLGTLRKAMVRSTEAGIFAFTNPSNRDARERVLMLLEELANSYEVDAIILDRIRYAGSLSDFSDSSRQAFERYLGKPVAKWPQDILDYGSTRRWYEPVPGRLFAKWASWRASILQSFIAEARSRVKRVRPNLPFAIYVGGWYPSYYEEATNWGSVAYRPPYGWAGPEWQRAGVAELLDVIFIGLYYRNLTIKEARDRRPVRDADWASIEGGITLAKTAVAGKTPIIGGINVTDYEDRLPAISAAASAILSRTDGIMIFDLVYVEAFDLWDELQDAFQTP